MSLDYVDQQIEAVRERAAGVQRNVAAQKERIQRDINLTQLGRDAALAKAHEEGKAVMARLRSEEDKLATDKLESLRRTVMGTVGSDSASIISYRDAQDRAAKIENREDAASVMQRALTSGDKTLASAIAEIALARGYRDVYKTYSAANPTIAEAARDLSDLNHYFTNGGLARAATYMV